MARRPRTIFVRASPEVTRQWRDALALFRAAHGLSTRDDVGNRLMRTLLARARADLKRKLGPDWRKHLQPDPPTPAAMPDRAKLDPPPMVD